jgi:hypothetical protein
MTDDEINASIAESCGWTEVNVTHRSGKAPNAEYVGSEFIPNYCNDLNAMHEAEKAFNWQQWNAYREELRTVVLGPIRMVSDWCKADLHATARQRAEAFLKTIGKWEE